jgi:hypothetical protein
LFLRLLLKLAVTTYEEKIKKVSIIVSRGSLGRFGRRSGGKWIAAST